MIAKLKTDGKEFYSGKRVTREDIDHRSVEHDISDLQVIDDVTFDEVWENRIEGSIN